VNDDAGKRGAVLITGAGSGLGLETALYLASRGLNVYGSVLTAAEESQLREQAARRGVSVAVVSLDVTDQAQIRACVQQVLNQSGSIDSLVYFAGLGLRGFFEDLTLEEVRQVYEVNVFGAMAVAQAVLPHMRRAGAGRIVLTSSVGGRMGSMTISGYSSSKFALEGFGECLRQEVYPFGIYVSMLEPGLVATPHFTVNRNRASNAVSPSSPYYSWFCQHEHIVDGILEKKTLQPNEVAETVYRILQARHPKLRYLAGRNAKLVLACRRYIPGSIFENIYWAILRKMVTRPRHAVDSLSKDIPGSVESGRTHSQ
jgi:NAD(P)-dependent dehydrogenase (short-subunit alcohol dehydrogenase family)